MVLRQTRELIKKKEEKVIVKLEVLYDDMNNNGGRSRDEVIRAIDRAMNGATWEASGAGWIARR